MHGEKRRPPSIVEECPICQPALKTGWTLSDKNGESSPAAERLSAGLRGSGRGREGPGGHRRRSVLRDKRRPHGLAILEGVHHELPPPQWPGKRSCASVHGLRPPEGCRHVPARRGKPRRLAAEDSSHLGGEPKSSPAAGTVEKHIKLSPLRAVQRQFRCWSLLPPPLW